jgi:hypothetical protein
VTASPSSTATSLRGFWVNQSLPLMCVRCVIFSHSTTYCNVTRKSLKSTFLWVGMYCKSNWRHLFLRGWGSVGEWERTHAFWAPATGAETSRPPWNAG